MKEKKTLGSMLKAFWLNLIGKKPTKLLNPEERINVQVHKLDEKTDTMHEALGISDDRAKAIFDMVMGNLKNGANDIVDIIEKISKDLTHPNELVYMTWTLQKKINETSSPMGGIMGMIIGDILKGKKGE